MPSPLRDAPATPERRRGRRWLAGTAAAVLAGATALALSAAPATAAPAPKYTPGKDTATFSALGVTDSNCFLGLGGNEIWVKPGDKIDFDSKLLGLDLNDLQLNKLTSLLGKLLGPLLGADVTSVKVAGLHVDVTIDKGTKAEQSFTVDSTDTTHFPDTDHDQHALGKGEHTLDWSVDSITLLPTLKGILGSQVGKLTTISLQQALGVGASLHTGAKLNWHGTIHVTTNAANCTLPAVSVPGVQVKVGKTKVSTGQLNVNPNKGTGLIGVDKPTGSTPPPAGHSTAPTGGHSPAADSGHHSGPAYVPPGTTVPERVVPDGVGTTTTTTTGGAGSGGFGNALPDLGGLVVNHDGALPQGAQKGSVPTGQPSPRSSNAADTSHHSGPVDLANDQAPTQQMPVLLAIIAIIALSLVTATYARLYLLRRNG